MRLLSEFNVRTSASDGLQSRCRECCRDWYLKHRADHIARDRSARTANVAYLLGGAMSWKSILAEIENCDVRCANCHSRRTAAQTNSWRHQFVMATERDAG
jgi:hypothetical protein